MSNPLEIEAILAPAFGSPNAPLLVRCIESARPLESGPKFMMAAHVLKNLMSLCESAGIDIEAATAWMKRPIDTSHPRAMAYSMVYSEEGSSLFSKILNEADAENMRHRLTYGPLEMQANTILELAIAYLVFRLSDAPTVGQKVTSAPTTEPKPSTTAAGKAGG